MIIQSRKHPDKTWDISLDTWNKMKSNGDHRKFRVLSSVEVPSNVAPPVEVQNFLNGPEGPEVKKIYEVEAEEMVTADYLEGLTKGELIEKYPAFELKESMKKEEMINKILD